MIFKFGEIMKKIKKGFLSKFLNGTKFVVCNHEQLKKKGWKLSSGSGKKATFYPGDYTHKDFTCGGIIQWEMIEDWQGKTLTVSGIASKYIRWYFVEENSYMWPVDQFLSLHTCIEGMTPIDGWFICKTCGDNLREIK